MYVQGEYNFIIIEVMQHSGGKTWKWTSVLEIKHKTSYTISWKILKI